MPSLMFISNFFISVQQAKRRVRGCRRRSRATFRTRTEDSGDAERGGLRRVVGAVERLPVEARGGRRHHRHAPGGAQGGREGAPAGAGAGASQRQVHPVGPRANEGAQPAHREQGCGRAERLGPISGELCWSGYVKGYLLRMRLSGVLD